MKKHANSRAALDPASQQREYYTKTAPAYDNMRRAEEWALQLADSLLLGVIDYIQAESLLDVGAGTGRTLAFLKTRCPGLRVRAIEPVDALRAIATQQKGLAEDEILRGDGTNIPFPDQSFDLVLAQGVLHHVPQPNRIIAEIVRTTRKAVVICDVNNVGHGPWIARRIKGLLRRLHLWKTINVLRTAGKGYYLSEGDGLAYSYSLFEDLPQIARAGFRLHVMNMGGQGTHPFYDAPGALVIGLK